MGKKRAGKSSTNLCQWCQKHFGTHTTRFSEHVETCQRSHENAQFNRELRQKRQKITHDPGSQPEVCGLELCFWYRTYGDYC